VATSRGYLIVGDAQQDPAVRALFDRAVEQVEAGTAVVDAAYPVGVVTDGQKILGSGLLEYRVGVGAGPAETFDADSAWAFVERLRPLIGWSEMDYQLQMWVERRLGAPYFVNRGRDWEQEWVLRPDADTSGVPDSFYDFACRIAIGELKHGPSYASVSANRIFGWVSALGSDLPGRLKKHGSGDLPADLARLQTDDVTITANDAVAVIRIVIRNDSAQVYEVVLDHLVRLVDSTDFPRSYAIEFRGPTKVYLPIKGLPKKGVHQLFAAAARHPELHELIERYARSAMREDAWYENLHDEQCAMPGTFAVFALGMADRRFAPLVRDYLELVDGEHQSLQAKFVEAYIDSHGATPESLAYLVACAGNIQHLRHRSTYPAMMANPDSLGALLALRGTDFAWRAALFALWGRDADSDRGAVSIVAKAPDGLKPLYNQVFDLSGQETT